MITITRNELNKVVLELKASTTLASPYFYILAFQPLSTLDQLADIIYFTSPDLSPYPCRYNLFEITESDSGSPGGNDVPIYLLPGQYEYSVYQSTTDSLDPDDFGTLIETGKMVVGDLTLPNPSTYVPSVYQ